MEDLRIFICSHNRITNELPTGKGYVIAALNEKVDNKELPIILMNDDFTEKHKIGYGECCLIHHVWQHPELLSQYVGFCHYRRFFEEFMHDTSNVVDIIKKHGAIYAKPWTCGLANRIIMKLQHFLEYINALQSVIDNFYPEYQSILKTFFSDKYCSYCNMFIMSKEDFLEGCDFVFGVLKRIDEYFNVNDDSEVRTLMTKYHDLFKWKDENIKWQVRMEGFFGEYLWDLYRRKKFENSYFSALTVIGDRDMSYLSK